MERFEVIIAGGGLAGLAAAYTLAGAGVETLLIERGDYPGSKNVTGGRIYLNPVRDLFPDLWASAPLERYIVREGAAMVTPERSVTFFYRGDELKEDPPQSYSVLRARFDRWFAEEAEARGAMIIPKTKVQDLIRQNGRVAGVVAGGDELFAEVVLICDGALSPLGEKAGLRTWPSPRHFALGVKEVIALDAAVINERFHLEGREGAAHLYVGDVTRGRFGGAFLYTNLESVSLGLVLGLDTNSAGENLHVPSLLEDFKASPEISPLVRGGQGVEYSAHVIPEGGYGGLGNLYGDGVLLAGDAAGFALNLGFTVRGMEYALASGYWAAQAVMEARRAGRYDGATLACYQRFLEESFVLKDFRAFRNNPAVLANPRLFRHYPELTAGILKDIYHVPAGPKTRLFDTVRSRLSLGELFMIIKDLKGFTKL